MKLQTPTGDLDLTAIQKEAEYAMLDSENHGVDPVETLVLINAIKRVEEIPAKRKYYVETCESKTYEKGLEIGWKAAIEEVRAVLGFAE